MATLVNFAPPSPWRATRGSGGYDRQPGTSRSIWNWSYSGDGITADGRFITDDTPDALGFYLITSITVHRNEQRLPPCNPRERQYRETNRLP